MVVTLRTVNLTDEEVDIRILMHDGYVVVTENGEKIFEGVVQTMGELLSAINKSSNRCRYYVIAE
jgi:hypothetical protein